MISVVISEKGGPAHTEDFDADEINIGRVQGNDIVLAKGNVSKNHSRIINKGGKLVVVDMRSTNGTFVNGQRISAPQVLRPNDKIMIGDYVLSASIIEDEDMEDEEV